MSVLISSMSLVAPKAASIGVGTCSASDSSSPSANVSVLVSVEALPLARAYLRQLVLDVPHVKVMFSNIGLDTMLRRDSLCRQFRDTFKYY